MIFSIEFFKDMFDLLEYTKGIEQGEKNHPEGDVHTHSMQCVSWALKESIDTDFILAALCHDIGKAIGTIGHEKHSINLCRGFLSIKSLWLIEHHLRVQYLYNGDIKRLGKVRYLLNHHWLPELVHLSRIDKLGRNPNIKKLITPDQICKRLNNCVDDHFLVNGSYKTRSNNL